MEKHENPTALRSKKWITEALLSLMQEKAFASIKIIEISKRADLTRQTFYQNFDSKTAVLDYYLDQLFEQFSKELQNADIQSGKKLTYCYFNFWSQYDDFLRLIIKNGLAWILVSKYPDYLDRLITVPWIQENNNSTDLSKHAYAYLSGALANVLIFWIKDEKRLTINQIAGMIEDIHNGKVFKL